METTVTKTAKKKVVPTTFGARVKEARESLGMSQGALARRLGVSRAAVSQWEDGTTKEVKEKHLEGLTKVLRKTREFLRRGKEVGTVELSDEADELAHAWEEMPDGEWKQRVYYFVTTFKMLGRQYHGEQQLSQAKHLLKGKKLKGRNH